MRNYRGELNENLFFTQDRKELEYWGTKSKAEVDFIRENKLAAYEIKSKPRTTRSMRSFSKK